VLFSLKAVSTESIQDRRAGGARGVHQAGKREALPFPIDGKGRNSFQNPSPGRKEQPMSFTTRKKASLFVFILVLLMQATQTVTPASADPPNPVAYFLGQDHYEQGGKRWVRYQIAVFNFDAYPNELFAPAPNLPPCGQNTKAARTWVEITDMSGKRIYGFCALATNSDLNKLWFAMEEDVVPPSYVYVILTDRQTGKTYKSNPVDTTL
jgi:hypothetical protein